MGMWREKIIVINDPLKINGLNIFLKKIIIIMWLAAVYQKLNIVERDTIQLIYYFQLLVEILI